MPVSATDDTRAYLQRVRHARQIHRTNPALLHANLKRLSDVRAAVEPSGQKSDFAKLVAESIETGFIRYSRRTRLLRKAATIGIGRFEANLIIAMEEHRAGNGWTPEKERKKRRWPMGWIAFAVVQSAIVLAVWWMLQSL